MHVPLFKKRKGAGQKKKRKEKHVACHTSQIHAGRLLALKGISVIIHKVFHLRLDFPRNMMTIPLVDLKLQYETLKKEILPAMERVCSQAGFIMGDDVTRFEEEFAVFSRSKHVVSCANGTNALSMALESLDIEPGDEIISVAFTWASTLFAITHVGAKPVLADIDPDTYLIDVSKIEEKISNRTRAILPVHLYGHPAPMDAIMDIAQKHGLRVVEDAAQAHGAQWKDQSVGSFGDISCYSFYPGKNLGAYGDAGAMVTNNDKLAAKLMRLRNLGQMSKSRLDTLQAAVLRIKLRYLKDWNEKRREAAKRYDTLLKGVNCKPPVTHEEARHVFHVYVIQVDRRDEVLKNLHAQGVMAQVHYPKPLHLQEAYRDWGLKRFTLPVSEAVAQRVLSLPLYPEITPEQQEYVVQALKKAIASPVGV
jgi:dTDP-4-amino-4,6-dideoxygalactose transaminase